MRLLRTELGAAVLFCVVLFCGFWADAADRAITFTLLFFGAITFAFGVPHLVLRIGRWRRRRHRDRRDAAELAALDRNEAD